ncbi:MAG: C45 family autoproteolytic acyltransferase/hydrolase, partial [Nannocystaceae bacterium]
QELAEIRTELALSRGAFASRDQLVEVALLHLQPLAAFSPSLSDELLGIARAAGITPAQAIILNHYTDLRDVPPAVLGAHEGDPGGCTAIFVNGPDGPVLGQTWDMHGTAAPHVRLLRIRPPGADTEVLCFTLAGCVGMTGMNQAGLAITINNLTSTDGQVGVVWPALVRRMLEETTAVAARDVLMGATLSSGHHYMIADRDDFYGVETSGKLKMITQTGPRAVHMHTNHCFDPVLRTREKISPKSTTFRRFELASTLCAQQHPRSAAEVWEFLGSHEGYPKSICSHVDDEGGDPSASRTCGAMLMVCNTGQVYACNGCVHRPPPDPVCVTPVFAGSGAAG